MRIFIGFSTGRYSIVSPISVLIRHFEKTEFSHCYIRFEDDKESRVYEAVWPYTRFIDFESWLVWNKPIKEVELNLTKASMSKFIAATYSQLGTDYSIDQIIRILFDLEKRRCVIGNNGNKRNICTEYVANCLMTLGVQFNKDLDNLKVSDIFKATMKLSGELR